jgi:predicted alpha/beta superfamily hydrolase
MHKMPIAVVALHLLVPHVALAEEPCKPTVVGDLRIEQFDSKMYARPMTVRVWTPPGYADVANVDRQYPTLYMLDGQGAFDDCTAFKGERELQLDETVTTLISRGEIQPMIVVGVDSGDQRAYEYAPYKNPITDAGKPDPIGRRLPEFFADELIPFVASKYRVTKDAAQVGIGGSSLGASAALHVSLMRPDLFGLALIQSPSLLLGNGQLLRDTMFIARAPDRVVIGLGGRELDFPGIDIDKYLASFRLTKGEAAAGAQKLTEILADHLRAAHLKRSDIMYQYDPEGRHSSTSWAQRMPASIVFLYGAIVKHD